MSASATGTPPSSAGRLMLRTLLFTGMRNVAVAGIGRVARMATGWLWEERYAWYDAMTWNDFAVDAARRRTCSRRRPSRTPRRSAGSATCSTSRACSTTSCSCARGRPRDEEILRVHTPEHLAHVRAVATTGGDAGDGTAMGRFGDEIAVLAAGGSIVAADAVLDGTVDNAYALVRPPGHHAEPGAVDGLLRLLEHRHRDPARPAGARRRARRGRRLGRPPRQRHRDDLPLRSETCSRSRCTRTSTTRRAAAASTSSARAQGEARISTSRSRPAAASRPTAWPSSASSCPRCARSGPS